ncbi:MAG: methylmalonyl-CoA carboxyltransferase, partial [Myxococcales bacterium]|nr:methylmalonyl-CoA carboxyltransferase [Myxococcales bacterium]
MSSPTQNGDVTRLRELEAESSLGGGEHLVRRQRRLGRLLPRERLETLFDPETMVEMGRLSRVSRRFSIDRADHAALGDGVLCALGRVEGRPVAAYAHDATVLRGAIGFGGAQKILRLTEIAKAQGIPVVALHDSDGVRVHEGPQTLAMLGDVLARSAELSGWVPQINVILGLCVGGAAYSAALGDVLIANQESAYAFVTGSKVTKIVTAQDAPLEEIGGASMHASTTGLFHALREDDRSCIALARRVLSYLPSNAKEAPPQLSMDDPAQRKTDRIEQLIPESDRKPYNVGPVLEEVFDRGSFLELQADFARSVVVGLARLGGRAVAVVASQPMHNAGCLDVDSSRKTARFVQLASAYGLPVITLADVPGFLPGKRQEQAGLLLHGAKVIAAYSACRTPLISVVLRKSYGGANVLSYPGDVRLALPYARVQAMGKEAAKAVARHMRGGEASDTELEAELERAFGDGWDRMERMAEDGFVDRIVEPQNLR